MSLQMFPVSQERMVPGYLDFILKGASMVGRNLRIYMVMLLDLLPLQFWHIFCSFKVANAYKARKLPSKNIFEFRVLHLSLVSSHLDLVLGM